MKALELVVPATPGPVPKLGPPQFTQADYEGRTSSATVHTRAAWVDDPLGGDDPMLEVWVNNGDRADLFDGQTSYARSEFWYEPQSDSPRVGDRFWLATSFLLGDGVKGRLFRQPSAWALGVYQLHPPVGDTSMLSPAVALDLDGGDISWRSHGQVLPNYGLGRRQWVLAEILVGNSSTGATQGGSQLWHGLDVAPDPDGPPKLPWKAYKTGSDQGGIPTNPALKGANWHKCGAYRLDQAADDSSFPWVIGIYSWAVQPTRALAIEKGWRSLAAPPPPPPADPVVDALGREWGQFMLNRPGPRGSWTQDQRWRADNPGALAKLVAYRDGGGPKPDLGPDGTGARMVEHVTAWLEAT